VHEVWNHGDSPRVALIVDVARPGMPALLRAVDRLYNDFVFHSKELQAFVARSEVGAKIEARPPADRRKDGAMSPLESD